MLKNEIHKLQFRIYFNGFRDIALGLKILKYPLQFVIFIPFFRISIGMHFMWDGSIEAEKRFILLYYRKEMKLQDLNAKRFVEIWREEKALNKSFYKLNKK